MSSEIDLAKFAYSEHRAAWFLDVSPALLRKKRNVGGGPRFFRMGKKILYKPEDLKAYVESLAANSVASTSEAASV